jgi:hypothetical protein
MIIPKTPVNGPVVALVETMLNKIAEIEAERMDIEMTHPLGGRINELLAETAALERQLAEITAPLDAQIASLRTAVIEQTLQIGGSVKGSLYQAIYAKGRVTWDGAKLDGYLIAHPELAAARRVGEPSVSIRPVKKPVSEAAAPESAPQEVQRME